MKWIIPASLSWTDTRQPFAQQFSDCYFSSENGLAETAHVFLDGNRLSERWHNLQQARFVIGETGFGTGLNFIAAWKLWRQAAPATAQLTFVSVEKHPLCKKDLIRAASLWPELKTHYDQLIEQYPPLTPGFHLLNFERTTLLLLFGDAAEMFTQLLTTDHPDFLSANRKVDAWFLDGFAPAKNPELWSSDVINTIALLSKPGTTAATFSAAALVKNNLDAAGFSVHKQKGFGNKRDMITAELQATGQNTSIAQLSMKNLTMKNKPITASSPYIAPWYLNSHYAGLASAAPAVTVLGAGIAGCSIARVLAERGCSVTVLEHQQHAATQASGNLQAVLYSKLSIANDEFAQINLACYVHALRFYKQLQKQYPAPGINLCGVLQLAWCDKEQQNQAALHEFLSHHPDLVTPTSREQASAIAGVEVSSGGLFFADAGWINPASVCRQLLQHPNIRVQFGMQVNELRHDNSNWQLLDNGQNILHTSGHLVLANGHHCHQFSQTQSLPLKLIRGQVSHVTPTPLSRQLKTVICGDGYIAPAQESVQSFGATYIANPDPANPNDLAITAAEHRHNLQQVATSSAALAAEWANQYINEGTAHYRVSSPDYLPLCGPVPDHAAFISNYGRLRKNANANIPVAGDYLPGLYLCTALGSRGMTYAPLCAEVISSHILGTLPPLPRDAMQALNPARFVIRDLIKNRI